MKPTIYWGFSGDVCAFYMITISYPPLFFLQCHSSNLFLTLFTRISVYIWVYRHLWTQKVCFRSYYVQQALIFILSSFQRCIFRFCIHHKLSPSTIRQNQISKCLRCLTYRVAYEIKQIVDNWMCIHKNVCEWISKNTQTNEMLSVFLWPHRTWQAFENPRMHVAYALE
jgi:hypothetical protein